MVCDGCWVQGDGPHSCDGVVQRVSVTIGCACGVDRGCRSWSTGDDFPHVNRTRFDRA